MSRAHCRRAVVEVGARRVLNVTFSFDLSLVELDTFNCIFGFAFHFPKCIHTQIFFDKITHYSCVECIFVAICPADEKIESEEEEEREREREKTGEKVEVKNKIIGKCFSQLETN